MAPFHGDWVAWVGRYEDLVTGSPGQYHVRLMDNTKDVDCAYPGVEVLPDGTYVLTTYGHWTKDEPPYIVSVRLKLEELDARLRPRPKDTNRPPGYGAAGPEAPDAGTPSRPKDTNRPSGYGAEGPEKR